MTIQDFCLNRQFKAQLFKQEDYPFETEYFYTFDLGGKEADLKLIEDKDLNETTFELYYQGRFIASGKLTELARIKAVVENTIRIFA